MGKVKSRSAYCRCVASSENRFPSLHFKKLVNEHLAKLRHSGMLLAGLKRLRFERPQGGPKGERSE